jgi:site-specific DNA-methyltransferase (adenine-specific)
MDEFETRTIGDGFTMVRGDCLEYMRTMQAGSVDAVITDPPYGNTKLHFDKYKIDLSALWKELNRIVKPKGAILIFSMQPFTTDLINSNRKNFSYEIIWCKTLPMGFLDANVRPLRAHENILLFANGRTTYNPQYWMREKYVKKRRTSPIPHYGKAENCNPLTISNGERYPLSWGIVSNCNDGSLHPTQKPIELIRYLVQTYTNENDTILDPFMGSGTTGVACHLTGRRFIGVELDAAYYEIACRRIAAALQQPFLFRGE